MREDINYNNIIDSDEARLAQAAADEAPNLPAEKIDPDKFYITQAYEKYTDENHEVWRELYERRWDVLEQQASATFINGLTAIKLVREHIPLLDGEITRPDGSVQRGINTYLAELTGWQSRAVPGYLPAKAFFACLAKREFPTTILIRPREVMDYLPEPDIFHDVFGHVPLHADPVFADFLQTYGKAALLCGDAEHVERLGRLFWFTVEFGLIVEDGRPKLYGSGLISSHGESKYALEGRWEKRGEAVEDCTPREQAVWRPFDLERVCETDFEIHHFQPIYYVLESFEQLRDAMNDYAQRVLDVAPAGAG